MTHWTNQQKAHIAVAYFRSRGARCPLDGSLLRIEDITGAGDMSRVIAAECPLCGNTMVSSEVQDEIIAESRNRVPANPSDESGDKTTSKTDLPRVFVSYSHDDEPHKEWVASLATRLRGDGVDVQLDQWTLVPGDQLPQYMETAIRENSYVLIVCTPNYKLKSDGRKGGVGYEGDIMTAEVHTKPNHRKFVPVLRSGTFETALPSWLAGKYGIDLRGDRYSEQQYHDLLATLHNRREQAPPLGKPPEFRKDSGNRKPTVGIAFGHEEDTGPTLDGAGFEPIRIVGVLADEVGQPRNDGTRGSALYEVPIKLSRTPPSEWAEAFIHHWDNPRSFTSMHRPGIAEVRSDRVVLTRTTLEELRDVHRETLKMAVEDANQRVSAYFTKRATAEERARQQEEEHRNKARRLADEIDFA